MAPLVDIAGVRYQYPGALALALEDVTLQLDAGLHVVSGPSGGGKSTMLRLLNGSVPHLHGGRISGHARVGGQDVFRTAPRCMARTVGFVFQDAERQAVHSTVERDVAFALENTGVDGRAMHARVETVLARFKISHLRARTIASLSGGERQRVAIAGAVVLAPRLLVLDEPLAQLDTAFADDLLRLLTELGDSGTTLVVAEHRLDDLLVRCDSIINMVRGRLTGPAPAPELAAQLDDPPQVVRLSARLGWRPPVLDARQLAGLRTGRRAWVPTRTRRPTAWEVDGVTSGPRDLLTNVSVQGGAGEVVVLMGRNGAGKTTLLRAIAGLGTVSRGRVWRRPGRVAYLPQNPAALLHRESIAAEMRWTIRATARTPAEAPADDLLLLDRLGLQPIADLDLRDLSSGQRQRGAIAAILAGVPSLALLDEPTRGMDGAARRGLTAAVSALAERGAAVVIATHDSELAAEVADRILIVSDGVVTDCGPPEAALSGPQIHATQLGRLFTPPGPVTVDAVAAALGPALSGTPA